MSKHSPGPWEYARMRLPPKAKDRRCGFVVNGQDEEGLSVSLALRICDMRVPAGLGGFAEGEANARLIAAAPDLYNALNNLVNDFDKSVRASDPMLVEARAALAKATGEKP